MSKAIKSLAVFLAVVCIGIFGLLSHFTKTLPDEYTAYRNEKFALRDFSTISYKNQPDKEIKVNTTLSATTELGELMLFNIIPIKEVNVRTTEKKYVVPCGNIFGIKLHTKGVVVIKCDDICVDNTNYNPGEESGLQAGDIITSINDSKITKCAEMQNAISNSNGIGLNIEYNRDGENYSTIIYPVETDSNGTYKAGIWIKDSCAGLGTMTFYDPKTKCFASLGHGICDNDTGELLPLDSAEITNAEISSITKGTNGSPGSLNGYFSDNECTGQAVINNETGLYGVLNQEISNFNPVEIATVQEIEKGFAQIICSIDNDKPKYYSVEITHIDYNEKNMTKNLEVTITDARLLEKTGGIVQGMSGSPILQNGKIVGAITHVLVTNSAKGYGIFAQNMFEQIEKNPILVSNG